MGSELVQNRNPDLILQISQKVYGLQLCDESLSASGVCTEVGGEAGEDRAVSSGGW